MRRRLFTRFLAATLAVVTGMSGSTLALAHAAVHARYAAEARRFENVIGVPPGALEASAESTGTVVPVDARAEIYESTHCQQCAERTAAIKFALPEPAVDALEFVLGAQGPLHGPRERIVALATPFRTDQPRAPPRLG